MTKHELYWLAGILEGEGTFGSYGYGQKPQARVAIAGTDKDVIIRTANLIGAKSVLRNTSCNRLGKKPQWRAVVYSTRAQEIMRLIFPLMGKRRKRQIYKALSR